MFRALIKSGVILLVMLRLVRPTGAREIADILGLEEHTTAGYLRHLARINIIIARSGYRGGYVLLDGRQLALGGARTVENLQFEPTTTTRYIDINIKGESLVVEEEPRTVEKLQFNRVRGKGGRGVRSSLTKPRFARLRSASLGG